jgi:hypothetical protein
MRCDRCARDEATLPTEEQWEEMQRDEEYFRDELAPEPERMDPDVPPPF